MVAIARPSNFVPATASDPYAPVEIEEYKVGEKTLWRVANLMPLKTGKRARSTECSILPWHYPRPKHNRRRIVVACGMGVDSIAMLVEMHRQGIRPDVIQWADTGSERKHTYQYINVMQAWCKKVGFPPIVIVRRHCPQKGHKSLYEQNWNTEQMPSPAFFNKNHSCSISWKLEPQRRWQGELEWLHEGEFDTAIGFEADESRRGKTIEAIGLEADETGRKSAGNDSRYELNDGDGKFSPWFPLQDWGMTRRDCVAAIANAGLPLPGKSACFHCPVSKICELKAMQKNEGDNFEAATALEERFRNGKNYQGKVEGLGMGKRWDELVESDDDETDVIGLEADYLPPAPIAKHIMTVEELGGWHHRSQAEVVKVQQALFAA